MPRSPKSSSPRKPAVGWREWVTLTDLCPAPIKVKVDTGARTSALHAFALEVVDVGAGLPVAHFEVHPEQGVDTGAVVTEAAVIEYREIRSSDGKLETRPVILTPVRLGDDVWDIQVSLTDRDQMGFRMLLGRGAVRRRYLVDPGRSYLRSAEDSPDLTDTPDEENS